MAGSTHLSTWVSNDAKRRFANTAARQSLSESALLKRLVEQMLASAEVDDVAESVVPLDPRDRRLTVRLVPEDRALLRERAAARTMPAATYVSVLVRSHLRQLAPLPDRELSSLQAAVRELVAIGRNLNTMTRLLPQDARQAVPGRQEGCWPCSGSARRCATTSVRSSRRISSAGTSDMPNRATRVGREEPLLDLRSFARPGPAGRVRFSPAQLEQIVRTASRTPEVVVKVSRGATSTRPVSSPTFATLIATVDSRSRPTRANTSKARA